MLRNEIKEIAENIIVDLYGEIETLNFEEDVDVDEVIFVLKDEYNLEDEDYLREIIESDIFGL